MAIAPSHRHGMHAARQGGFIAGRKQQVRRAAQPVQRRAQGRERMADVVAAGCRPQGRHRPGRKARRPGARLGVQRLPGLGRAGIGQPQAPAIAQQASRRTATHCSCAKASPAARRPGAATRSRRSNCRRAARTPAPAPARAARADRAPTGTPDSRRRNSPPPHPAAQRPARATTALQAHAVGDGEVGKRGGRFRIRRAAAKTRAQRIGRQHAGMARIQRGAGPSHPDAHPASGWTSPPTGASACWLPEMPCSSSTTARACAGSGP